MVTQTEETVTWLHRQKRDRHMVTQTKERQTHGYTDKRGTTPW